MSKIIEFPCKANNEIKQNNVDELKSMDEILNEINKEASYEAEQITNYVYDHNENNPILKKYWEKFCDTLQK